MDENSGKKRDRTWLGLGLVAAVMALLCWAEISHQHAAKQAVPKAAPAQTTVEPTAPAIVQEATDDGDAQPAEPEKPTRSKISYPNGHSRTILTDSQGTVLSYTDNVGILWKLDPPEVKDGEYTAKDQEDIWHRFRADGTVIAGTDWHGSAELKDDNSVVLHDDDGSTTYFEADGSTINRDGADRITMIQYPNGGSRSFEYVDTTADSDFLSIDETAAGGTESYWKRVEKDDDHAFQRCRMENHVCNLYGALYDLSFVNDTGELTFTNRDDNSTITHYANGTSISSNTEK